MSSTNEVYNCTSDLEEENPKLSTFAKKNNVISVEKKQVKKAKYSDSDSDLYSDEEMPVKKSTAKVPVKKIPVKKIPVKKILVENEDEEKNDENDFSEVIDTISLNKTFDLPEVKTIMESTTHTLQLAKEILKRTIRVTTSTCKFTEYVLDKSNIENGSSDEDEYNISSKKKIVSGSRSGSSALEPVYTQKQCKNIKFHNHTTFTTKIGNSITKFEISPTVLCVSETKKNSTLLKFDSNNKPIKSPKYDFIFIRYYNKQTLSESENTFVKKYFENYIVLNIDCVDELFNICCQMYREKEICKISTDFIKYFADPEFVFAKTENIMTESTKSTYLSQYATNVVEYIKQNPQSLKTLSQYISHSDLVNNWPDMPMSNEYIVYRSNKKSDFFNTHVSKDQWIEFRDIIMSNQNILNSLPRNEYFKIPSLGAEGGFELCMYLISSDKYDLNNDTIMWLKSQFDSSKLFDLLALFQKVELSTFKSVLDNNKEASDIDVYINYIVGRYSPEKFGSFVTDIYDLNFDETLGAKLISTFLTLYDIKNKRTLLFVAKDSEYCKLTLKLFEMNIITKEEIESLPPSRNCVVCDDRMEEYWTFVPCGHCCMCRTCYLPEENISKDEYPAKIKKGAKKSCAIPKVSKCPMCRENVTNQIKVYV